MSPVGVSSLTLSTQSVQKPLRRCAGVMLFSTYSGCMNQLYTIRRKKLTMFGKQMSLVGVSSLKSSHAICATERFLAGVSPKMLPEVTGVSEFS